MLLPAGDPVEVGLHRRREVVVDEPGEVLLHEPRDGEGQPAGHEGAAPVRDVAAVLDRPDRRRVGRRPADALLLHRLDEGRLRVARRRRRLVPVRLGPEDRERGTLAELGKAPLLLGDVLLAHRLLLVATLLVCREEATEGDDRPARRQLDLSGGRSLGEARRDLDGCGRAAGVGHLRGDRALPDQLVEGELLAAQLAGDLGGRAEPIPRGADRLVRLLRVLDLLLVHPGRVGDVLGAVEVARLLTCGGEGGGRQGRAVGPHVGDVAVLVEPLRDPHRVLAREAQLAGRLLLECRGGEGRGGAPRVGLLGDRAHAHPGVGAERGEGIGDARGARLVELDRLGVGQGAVVGEVPARRDALTVDARQPRREPLGLAARRELAVDVPVGRRDEGHPLALPLDDHPGRDGLDPTGGQPRPDLAPQHRRDLVAVEPVEDAAGLLGVDEPGVELAGGARGALDGLLGDLVEDHPLDGHRRLEGLEQVPGDGLALAVLVGREVELGGVLELALELADLLLLVRVDDVVGLEVVLDVDPELPERALLHLRRHLRRGRDVADVAYRRLDVPVRPQIARDRLRLRGRLDDDELAPRAQLLTCRPSPACSGFVAAPTRETMRTVAPPPWRRMERGPRRPAGPVPTRHRTRATRDRAASLRPARTASPGSRVPTGSEPAATGHGAGSAAAHRPDRGWR